jgi:glycosyltransferase involved in cell wall biosynthesis
MKSVNEQLPGTDLCVIVPVYNEELGLEEFCRRMLAVLEPLDLNWQLLFVDDGSIDGSVQVIEDWRERDQHIGLIILSRNFGKELAMTAGLDHADANAVVIIDADLQDPPELIPQLLERWREGFDVVYAQRNSRQGDSWLKRATAAAFYRVINWVSRTSIPKDTGDFRLLSRRAVAAVGSARERHRFMKGLFAWVGFRQVAVGYERETRHAGSSKFNYWRLWNFALDGITSFTTTPLRVATWLGLLVALGAMFFGLIIIFRTLMWGDPVPGYPSLMVVILFLGGIQLVSLGIIGEYLGRLFEENKQRPLYLIDSIGAPRAGGQSTNQVQ